MAIARQILDLEEAQWGCVLANEQIQQEQITKQAVISWNVETRRYATMLAVDAILFPKPYD